MTTADYVIVGAGPAGCVLAERLRRRTHPGGAAGGRWPGFEQHSRDPGI